MTDEIIAGPEGVMAFAMAQAVAGQPAPAEGCPTQDLILDFATAANATIAPFASYDTGSPPAFGTVSYPADDDPRFPYRPRQPHSTGFQFDVYCIRQLSADYASGLLDEFGSPLTDEYGAQIR